MNIAGFSDEVKFLMIAFSTLLLIFGLCKFKQTCTEKKSDNTNSTELTPSDEKNREEEKVNLKSKV